MKNFRIAPHRPHFHAFVYLSVLVVLCCGGCRKAATPVVAPIDITSGGAFDATEAMSVVATQGLFAVYFPKVMFGKADDELAYLIVFDIPRQWVQAYGGGGLRTHNSSLKLDLDIDRQRVDSIDDATIWIAGREYRLGDGRVLLVDVIGGPDRVIQLSLPPGVQDPEQAVRQLARENTEFRRFIREELHAAMDSISLRSDAALLLYKSTLATELPHEELREWLDDDNAWVRLMAAGALWDATKDPEALDVLTNLAESEPSSTIINQRTGNTANWPAKLARGKLNTLRSNQDMPKVPTSHPAP